MLTPQPTTLKQAMDRAAVIIHAKDNEEAQVLEDLVRMKTELDALRQAAENFIAKVETGGARSVRSYAEFKAALALGKRP